MSSRFWRNASLPAFTAVSSAGASSRGRADSWPVRVTHSTLAALRMTRITRSRALLGPA